jgi:streptogramin lyase
MYVTYSGGGMNDPSAIGVDSLGNLWVSNYFNTVSYFNNTGSAIFPSGLSGNQLEESYGGAVDNTNTYWPVDEESQGFNSGNGSVDVFNTSGNQLGILGVGGINFPLANAFDTSANMWVVDYGDSSVSVYKTTENPLGAVPLPNSPYTSPQLEFPVAVAMDAQCNAFIADQATNTITKVIGDGSSFTSFVVGNGPSGVAVDEAGNVWSANYYGNSVGLFKATGQVLSGTTGISGGGLSHPQGIAVDGAGTVWVANYRGPSISELAPSTSSTPGALLSPTAGWGPDAQLLEAFAIAVDPSGNLWTTNFGNNTLTEFVGMAAPVKTPLLGVPRVP